MGTLTKLSLFSSCKIPTLMFSSGERHSGGFTVNADNLGEIGARPKVKPDEPQAHFNKNISSINLLVHGYEPVGEGKYFSIESTLIGKPVQVTVVGKPMRIYFDVHLVTTWEQYNLSSIEKRRLCRAITDALAPVIAPLILKPTHRDVKGEVPGRVLPATLDLSGHSC